MRLTEEQTMEAYRGVHRALTSGGGHSWSIVLDDDGDVGATTCPRPGVTVLMSNVTDDMFGPDDPATYTEEKWAEMCWECFGPIDTEDAEEPAGGRG